jgi:hypothetical protein
MTGKGTGYLEVMMIHIKLVPKRSVGPDENDPMGRSWVGYEPGMPPLTVYEQNRGLWVLGTRADRQQFAVFSDTEMGLNRCVVELTGIEAIGTKKAIIGRVLGPGHPVHDALIEAPAADSFRNPLTYPPDPGTVPLCACGCGDPVSERSQFLAGHDQRAIHARIAKQWSDTLGFITWFDETFGAPDQPSQLGG